MDDLFGRLGVGLSLVFLATPVFSLVTDFFTACLACGRVPFFQLCCWAPLFLSLPGHPRYHTKTSSCVYRCWNGQINSHFSVDLSWNKGFPQQVLQRLAMRLSSGRTTFSPVAKERRRDCPTSGSSGDDPGPALALREEAAESSPAPQTPARLRCAACPSPGRPPRACFSAAVV